AIWLWPPSQTGPTILLAQAGERLEGALPDGSSISLNAGSEVRYVPHQWDQHRRLELKGEAYFEVEKGSSFEVATELGIVTVLGTRFNVRARDGKLKVTCYEGRVRVKEGQYEVEIKAGEEYNQAAAQAIDQVKKPSWTQDIINLTEATMSEVIAEMERQFDVTIEASDLDLEVVGTYNFSVTSLTDAVDQVFGSEKIRLVKVGEKQVRLQKVSSEE
ncbi:MAG: FecR domain-containing protein, partial [Bacteroidota bacterium]